MMTDNTENHTIRLLQEMREDMRGMRDDINARLDGITHIMTLMAAHSHTLDERIGKLEDQQEG